MLFFSLRKSVCISLNLLCIFSIGFFLSCKKSNNSSEQQDFFNKNILRYDVNAPFTSLNPPDVKASGSNNVFPLLYSYLFVPNSSGKLTPDLATKWVLDSDNLRWTIHLRKDAVFHNSKAVTSNDVKYSYEKWIKNFRPNLSSVINRISLLSDSALCIHLYKEDPLILQKVWDFEIVPHAEGGEIDFFNHPIGSGPFKFKHRKGAKKVVLEDNEDYFLGRPSPDQIIFYFEPDKERSWSRLLAGDTDIAQEISPENYEMIRQYEDRFYFDLCILSHYTILLYNTYDPLFSDLAVRRALTLAIDREYIAKEILRGYGKVAVGPMGIDSPYHNPEVNPLPFDPQKAISLLKTAGWSHDGKDRWLYRGGKPFEFKLLLFKESQIEKKVTRYIQLCLNNIGIKVHLKAYPFEELKKAYFRNNEFQAVLTEIDGASRNPEFLKSLWTSGASRKSEAGCFKHPKVNRLIQKAFDEKNPEKRKKFFFEIDALITSLQPGTFLYQKTAINAMSKRFSLPYQFSLIHEGIHRLRRAALTQNWKINNNR